ncbi:hypothetical protein, partial [Mycobacterium avium]|uniref:hypothetical protein n=1 Tax=Mycobacterium avium TaxID=1764 RepID=UPI001F23C4C4
FSCPHHAGREEREHMNQLGQAVLDVAERSARGDYVPPKIWHVGEDAAVDFGTGNGHPFDGLTITHWSVD